MYIIRGVVFLLQQKNARLKIHVQEGCLLQPIDTLQDEWEQYPSMYFGWSYQWIL